MEFNAWLLSIGKAERTANSYSAAINGVISDWVIANHIANERLNNIRSYSQIKEIVRRLEAVDIYVQRNTDGNNMYSAALNKYIEYLYEWSVEDIETDIDAVIFSDELESTEKSALISARIGQGVFRNGVINYWNGCALTGYRNTRLLVASHIKPWKVSNNVERLDPNNGLLLLPNFDKAFDLGFITFQTGGEILVSPALETPHDLGVENTMRVDIANSHQAYMEYHRNEVYQH